MTLTEVVQYIIDSEMDLDELVQERLKLSHEDLVAELIGHIKANIHNFQDLE